MNNAQALKLFRREIDICSSLDHVSTRRRCRAYTKDNICRLIEFYEDPQHICLVLEFVDGEDLLKYVHSFPGPGLRE